LTVSLFSDSTAFSKTADSCTGAKLGRTRVAASRSSTRERMPARQTARHSLWSAPRRF
jgi:hypothetical protein